MSETSRGWRRVLAILSWKMRRSAQLQSKRQPSQGRPLLLLNTKRPENRGSRQIFCPTQPVHAQIFRHVRELWTWSMRCALRWNRLTERLGWCHARQKREGKKGCQKTFRGIDQVGGSRRKKCHLWMKRKAPGLLYIQCSSLQGQDDEGSSGLCACIQEDLRVSGLVCLSGAWLSTVPLEYFVILSGVLKTCHAALRTRFF